MPLARRTPLRANRPTARRGSAPSFVLDREAREGCRARAGGQCQARIPDICTGYGSQAHHLRRRSQGGTNEPANLAWLCGNCHGWVHHRPDWSGTVGLLIPRQALTAPLWDPSDGQPNPLVGAA